jgi:hypothetical protein
VTHKFAQLQARHLSQFSVALPKVDGEHRIYTHGPIFAPSRANATLFACANPAAGRGGGNWSALFLYFVFIFIIE